MTTQQKREAIRQDCIAANPEIVELKFGCFITDKHTILISQGGDFGNEILQTFDTDTEEVGGIFASHIDDGSGGSRLETVDDLIESGELEIIGRPIRLADVLLAIKEPEDKVYCVAVCGRFYWSYADSDSHYISTGAQWNLRKNSLDDQDEPTIDFIHSILFP